MLESPEILIVFPSCIHVGVWHSDDLLESGKVTAALRSKARSWAEANGATLGSGHVSGWTLGPDRNQTRAIYGITREA